MWPQAHGKRQGGGRGYAGVEQKGNIMIISRIHCERDEAARNLEHGLIGGYAEYGGSPGHRPSDPSQAQ